MIEDTNHIKFVKNRYFILLLLIPILTIISFKFLNSARGPYFYGHNSDPEYAYLFNSLQISELKSPSLFQHPGTPLQLLGGLYIKSINFNHQQEIQQDVFNNSEQYLSQLNILLVAIFITCILLLGIVSYKLTGNIWISLLLQSSHFYSPHIYSELTRFRPDSLLISIVFLFITIIIMTLRFNIEKYSKEYIATFSILTGMGIATKIVFFPLIIIPIVLMSQLKNKLLYLLFTVLSFCFFTIPIWPKFWNLILWVRRLLIHDGRYGQGNKTFIDTSSYFNNLLSIFSENFIFSFTLCTAFLFVVYYLIKLKNRQLFHNNFKFRVLVGLVLAQIFQILIVSKHFSPHYLLPALMLTGTTILYLGLNIQSLINIKINTYFSRLLLPFTFTMFLVFTTMGIKTKVLNLSKTKLEADSLILSMNHYPTYSKIYYYRSSSIKYALKFGNDWANKEYGIKLNSMFDGNYFYNIWNRKYYDFVNVLDIEQIKKNNSKILFQGTSFERKYKNTNFKPNLKLLDIYSGDNETIYMLQNM